MLLKQYRIIDGKIITYDKVKVAIDRPQAFEPPDGYWLAFSGGKDSVVLKALADMAGVKYEAHYSLTNVDPPELMQFIKTFDDVVIDRPKETMWQLIVRKRMPPTRIVRYCCEALKESAGKNRVTLTGVRWAESVARKKNRNLVDIGRRKRTNYNDDNDESRRAVENCYKKQMTLVNPIIDWTDEDVWEFIREYKIPYCKLYDEGWKRLGCIGCPMANQEVEFDRWPKYKQMYIRAFQRMIDKRKEDGLETEWGTGEECMEWWLGKTKKEDAMDGQIEMEQSDEQPGRKIR